MNRLEGAKYSTLASAALERGETVDPESYSVDEDDRKLCAGCGAVELVDENHLCEECAAEEPPSDSFDCGRCDGDGEIGWGAQRQTCPVCRGSTLSSFGEAELRRKEEARKRPPLCDRCETAPATDGEYCAGCHDFIGESQDERAAR